jgi:hypothetical protein
MIFANAMLRWLDQPKCLCTISVLDKHRGEGATSGVWLDARYVVGYPAGCW